MKKPLSYIEISKGNLVHNLRTFRKLAQIGTALVAVVKANAYGHGLREVVSIAEKHVDYFQVDDIEELRELRRFSQKPTFVFGYVQKSDLQEMVNLGGIPGVYDVDKLKQLNTIGKRMNKKVTVHLKIDALLGRQGIMIEDVESYGKLLKRLPFIHLESIYSHFSNIEDTANLAYARQQYGELLKAKETLQRLGFVNISHHISATSGVLADPKHNWHGSVLRLGIGMYGLWPSKDLHKKYAHLIQLKPVLRWVTHLAQIKTIPKGYAIGYGKTFISKKVMTIGVVPQGYSDGYDRKFSNNGFVVIHGKQCPILGRIAMNMFVVDISHITNPKLEDEVVLLGKQKNEEITAESLGDAITTINYEIVARISSLLPRKIV